MSRPRSSGADRVLQRDGDHVVTLVGDGTTVAKSFPSGPEHARRAASELERLQRMYSALASIDGVRCPRPIELRLRPNPVLTMEFVDGVPMTRHLASRSTDRAFGSRLARLLVDAAHAYARVTGDALPDLHFRNMLYDPVHGDVVLLDFGEAHLAVAPSDRDRPLDAVGAGVARLAGSTLFECARLRNLLRPRVSVATARAARATVEEAAARRGAERRAGALDELGDAARQVYRDLTEDRGFLRRVWYGTVGAVLARSYGRVLLPHQRPG